MSPPTIGTPLLWAGFLATVLALLAVDLGLFHRKAHEVKVKEALAWTGVWIALAAAFGVGVHHWFGPEKALEFATGYVIEKALSVDNLFVFVVLFSAFAVPARQQHRVLFWGVLGALVMRAVFVLVGAALLQAFHWMMYVFGAFLVITAVKLLASREEEAHPEQGRLVRLFRRLVPVTEGYRGERFLVREAGRWLATPLLVVLVAVEVTDLVFAVDSIPAVFAVTTDPFIVFTSNVFAILGLRSLYFALAAMLDKLRFLKVGLALVLAFVGAKMLAVGLVKVPIGLSLGVIATILVGASLASLLWPAAGPARDAPGAAAH